MKREDFHALVEASTERFANVKYIGNCRTSFYPEVKGIERHFRHNLSDDENGAILPYRQWVVSHILESCAPGIGDSIRNQCRDLPVLAVFLHHLIKRDSSRAELQELVTQPNFEQWLLKRVEVTLERKNSGLLATLVGCFPRSPFFFHSGF